jgi:1-deoxy-D-xylulose-5-phosphate synthase
MIHDVAIQSLPVIFVLDRAGVVGADGPTHHGAFDLTYLRLVPGMIVMSPKDENELRDMLFTALSYQDGPVALRYPRGNGVGVQPKKGFDALPIGKAETLRHGGDVAILAIGAMTHPSLKAAELLKRDGIEAEVVNMRFVKPLDGIILDEIATRFSLVMTVEDNTVRGGFGSAVAEYYVSQKYKSPSLILHGLPDRFIEQGTPAELYRDLKLDPEGIASIVASSWEAASGKTRRHIEPVTI